MLPEVAVRVVGVIVCLAVLTGLSIAGGADWPSASGADPDAGMVEGEGHVIDAEQPLVRLESKVVVALEGDEETLTTVEEGEMAAFYGEVVDEEGTAESDMLVEVDRLATREPWEITYMFAISIVGAIGALLAVVNYWRLDPHRLRVEPRERPVIPVLGRDRDG